MSAGASELPRPVEAVNPRRLVVSHCGEWARRGPLRGRWWRALESMKMKDNEPPSAEERLGEV